MQCSFSFFRDNNSSKQRGNQPEKVLKKSCKWISLTRIQRNLLTVFQRIQEVLLYLRHRSTAVYPDAAFKMEVQAAKIQICCSHSCCLVIRNKSLRVNKAFGIFVNLDAAANQLPVIGTGCHVNQSLIPNMWCDDSNIHAAFFAARHSEDTMLSSTIR